MHRARRGLKPRASADAAAQVCPGRPRGCPGSCKPRREQGGGIAPGQQDDPPAAPGRRRGGERAAGPRHSPLRGSRPALHAEAASASRPRPRDRRVTPLQPSAVPKHRSPPHTRPVAVPPRLPACPAVLTADAFFPSSGRAPACGKPRQRPLMAALRLRRPRRLPPRPLPAACAAPDELRPTAAAGLPQGAAGRRTHGAARRAPAPAPGAPRPAAVAGHPAGG